MHSQSSDVPYRAAVPLVLPAQVLGFALGLVPVCFLPAISASGLGYTWSLLVFAVPAWVLAKSLSRRGVLALVQRPLLSAAALLVPMGVLLNLCFADDFFVYPSTRAVIGWAVPAFDLGHVDWAHPIPLEEFGFYGLGFLTMLLGYAWADDVVPLRRRRQGGAPGWLEGLLVPVGLVAVGVALAEGSVPSYWIYLAAVPLPVTLVLWPLVRARLNLRALAVVMVVLVPTSFVWESVLAVPRGWWGYQAESMLGVRLFGLPAEAVVVWLLAPVTTAVVFEFFRSSRWRVP